MEPITLGRNNERPQERARKLPSNMRATWLFKACRRCGGDLTLQADEYGDRDYTCIQCGAIQPFSPLVSWKESWKLPSR